MPTHSSREGSPAGLRLIQLPLQERCIKQDAIPRALAPPANRTATARNAFAFSANSKVPFFQRQN